MLSSWVCILILPQNLYGAGRTVNHLTQDYLIGTQLDEYRLENLIGRGGMARVYRGLDVNLNRTVAIKVIDIPHLTETEYNQRFKREAQAIARLDHPHIVRLYRFGEVNTGLPGDSILYMAMQFIKGADLQFVLDSYRKDGEFIETKEAGRIIREACEALDYAHANGIIHRDIKPSNIMLDSQGRAILTDFGLALLSSQATRGEIFGSPDYIAPEQVISSAKAVPQSDLYAVGVILYEMFTGVLPFTAKDPLDLAMMHVNSPVPSPREVRPEISRELESVILKALAKRPEDRYPTGQALSEAVDKALAGKSPEIPATRMTIPQRVSLGLGDRERLVNPPRSGTPPTRKSVVPNMVLGAEAQPRAENLPPEGILARTPAADPSKDVPGGHPPVPKSAPPLPVQPHARKQNSRSWIFAGLGGLLILLLCMGGSGLILVSQLLTKGTDNPAASLTPEISPTPSSEITHPTATLAQTQASTAAAPALPPTIGPASAFSYWLRIIRGSEDKGYLVLINTGSVDIPVGELSLRAGKDQISGLAWIVSQLPPGACLTGRKEERKRDGLPAGIDCQPMGQTVGLPNSQDGVFKEKLSVYYRDRLIGTCDREEFDCQFTFSD